MVMLQSQNTFNRMGIFLSLLFFVLSAVANSEEVSSSQLGSKIFQGNPAEEEKSIYMASLQVNSHHVCGSGIFSEDALVTSGQCVDYIKKKIENTSQRATAVLGHIDLSKGDIYNIKNLVYHPKYKILKGPLYGNFDPNYDFGIVLLERTINARLALRLPLYISTFNARYFTIAMVSGWGTTDADDKTHQIGTEHFAMKLHFMRIVLRGTSFCKTRIKKSNFVDAQTCGVGEQGQRTTIGDIGSPLVMSVYTNGTHKDAIIGITCDQLEYKESSVTRFVRISFIHKEIDEMFRSLSTDETRNENCESSSQQEVTGQKRKYVPSYEVLQIEER